MQTQPGWFTSERLSTLTLLAATAVSVWLCYLLVRPFLPALAWALAFSVFAFPLHRRLETRINASVAAFLTCCVVTIALAIPSVLVTRALVSEAAQGAALLQDETANGKWREDLRGNAVTKPIWNFVENHVDVKALMERASGLLAAAAKYAVSGSFSAALQFAIALFVLFFMLRDRHEAVARLRSLLPMDRAEADALISRVGDAVYATVFGRIVVALVQGAVSAVIFAILGVSTPILWGTVTFVAANIPVLGAMAVWAPVALYLALTGSWVKALILTAFGTAGISVIDNFLYPVLIGKKMRAHTVPVFLSLMGGIALVGASGIVIGPMILAVTTVLLDVWCSRNSCSRPAESPDLRRPPAAA